jgi:hypothetical protein
MQQTAMWNAFEKECNRRIKWEKRYPSLRNFITSMRNNESNISIIFKNYKTASLIVHLILGYTKSLKEMSHLVMSKLWFSLWAEFWKKTHTRCYFTALWLCFNFSEDDDNYQICFQSACYKPFTIYLLNKPNVLVGRRHTYLLWWLR